MTLLLSSVSDEHVSTVSQRLLASPGTSVIGRGSWRRWWLTLSRVAGLVVLGEPSQVDVLDPRNPLLVLRVVCLLCPLCHDE